MGLVGAILYYATAIIAFAAYAVIAVLRYAFNAGKALVGAFNTQRSGRKVSPSDQQELAAKPTPMATQISGRDRNWELGRDIANYHASVIFSDDFSASIAVFKTTGLVRRKVRAISAAASMLMLELYTRDTFELPDLTLSDTVTLDKIVLDTEAIGIRFIEDLLKKKDPKYFGLSGNLLTPNTQLAEPQQSGSGEIVKQLPPDETKEQALARSLALLRGSMASVDQTVAIAPAEMKTGVVVTKRESKGTVVGRIQTMGMRDIPPTNGKKGYATFEATLLQNDGQHVSFRGVRLNELFVENGVKEGDLVEIQSLGRTKVAATQEDERPTYRNEFLVKVLENA